MEEYTIVTQGSATYLERTLGAEELLDEVDRGMLASNQIGGLLPVSIQWLNADCRLLYNITGLTPLAQAARILEHETRLSNFFMALCKAEKECDEYLLDPRKIDLTPEYVYLDATGRAYVMYIPVQAASDRYDPVELARYVLRMVGQQMPQESRVVGILSRQLLYGGRFSFAELEKQIKVPLDQPSQQEPIRVQHQEPVEVQPHLEQEFKKPALSSVYGSEAVAASEPVKRLEPQPVQDNPFAQQTDNPFASSQPEVQPQKKDKKAEKKAEKEKKSGGLFGGLFGGKKDKKKSVAKEQDNPFQQEKPALTPAQSAYKAASAPAYVPPQQPVQQPRQGGGHTVIFAADDGGAVRTTIMGSGASGETRELYLVQKATNQYIHVTHTNFHIGRAENIVDYTVHTQNCYLGNDHAYILIENGCYYIVDNNTQNHTYLNEKRLEPSKPTQFHAGDTIRMADVVFSVVAGS